MRMEIEAQGRFMQACEQVTHTLPTAAIFNLVDWDLPTLYSKLIDEELREVKEALEILEVSVSKDERAEAMARLTAEVTDLLYVVFGFINSLGLPVPEMFDAIHGANMRKVGPDGKVIKDPQTGKVLKPEGWVKVSEQEVFLGAVRVRCKEPLE